MEPDLQLNQKKKLVSIAESSNNQLQKNNKNNRFKSNHGK